jgi:hypothetical protein
MPVYKLTPDISKTLRKRFFRLFLPLMLFAGGVAILISVSASDATEGFVFAIPLFVLLLSIALLRSYKRARQQYLSFELTTASDQITRRMLGLSEVTLRREDIRRIEKQASGEITLRSSRPRESIRIPGEVERREELLSELEVWQPVEEGRSSPSAFLGTAVGIACIMAFATVALSNSRYIIITVGTLLFLGLCTSAVLIWRNRGLDARTRRMAFLIAFPAIAILFRVVLAWQGRL